MNEDWAYLAGLIDGEGCITIDKIRLFARNGSGKFRWRYKLSLRVAMCDKPTLDWIARLFAGKVYPRSRNSMKRLSPKARQQWCWVTTDSNAERVIVGIQPWLKNKLVEANAALAFRKTVASEHRLSPATLAAQEMFKLQLMGLKRQEYLVAPN